MLLGAFSYKSHKFLMLFLFFSIAARSLVFSETTDAESGRVKILSFNIKFFGQAKMAKDGVSAILADIVSHSDITAIQEVRSAGIAPVEQFMAMLRESGGGSADLPQPEKYGYVLGPLEGRSSYKERYWIIYDKTKFTVLAEDTYFDPEDKFERNPLAVHFQTGDRLDFILINNHIKPGNAKAEIESLPEAAAYYQELWGERDVFMVGDFNADGQYYDESQLAAVFPEGAYRIVITNEDDTTVAANVNTYDRFIITNEAVEDFTGNSGVIRFDELYDFNGPGITPNMVSDHYPVWAEFYTRRDTD
jgi:endonuclease/exonuclease/phosphatase family metal-dependent hydrolase